MNDDQFPRHKRIGSATDDRSGFIRVGESHPLVALRHNGGFILAVASIPPPVLAISAVSGRVGRIGRVEVISIRILWVFGSVLGGSIRAAIQCALSGRCGKNTGALAPGPLRSGCAQGAGATWRLAAGGTTAVGFS